MTTMRSMLYPEEAEAEGDVRRVLQQGAGAVAVAGAAAGLGPSGPGVVVAQVARAILGQLELPLSAVLLNGLKTYEGIVDAAQRTAAVPGSEELVRLEPLTFSSVHQPTVDLVVDDRIAHAFQLQLRVVGTLYAVMATIAGGRITQLLGGQAELTVSLAVDGNPVRERTITTPVPVTADVNIAVPLSGVS